MIPRHFVHSVAITSDIISTLKEHQKRTGITPFVLLKKQDHVPEGLTAKDIVRWCDKYGAVKAVYKAHLDFVLECWEKEPDKHRMAKESRREPIPDAYLKTLEEERGRTGLNTTQLLKKSTPLPKGLSVHIVRSWVRGTTKQAYPQYMEFVLNAYKEQPDHKPKQILEYAAPVAGQEPAKCEVLQRGLKPIAKADLERMQRYRDIIGILPGFIFKNATEVPEGLSPLMVSGWLDGRTKSAQPAHIRWVLKQCKKIIVAASEMD